MYSNEISSETSFNIFAGGFLIFFIILVIVVVNAANKQEEFYSKCREKLSEWNEIKDDLPYGTVVEVAGGFYRGQKGQIVDEAEFINNKAKSCNSYGYKLRFIDNYEGEVRLEHISRMK